MFANTSSRYTCMRRGSTSAGAGACAGSRKCAVNAYCSACVWLGAADMAFPLRSSLLARIKTRPFVARLFKFNLDTANMIELADQFGQRRNAEIALEQGRLHAAMPISMIEQIEHRIDDRGGMTVDDQPGCFVEMSGDVHVDDALRRQR